MVETINDIEINDAKTNDINTYVFSDRHPRLMKQIAYYVASKTAEEWNDVKTMNNNKRRKLDNCRSLSIMKHYTEEQKKKGRKIHYTLAKDVKCHYVYQGNDFWFMLKELGDILPPLNYWDNPDKKLEEWQINTLNYIKQNKSILVRAPTSSGKSFIALSAGILHNKVIYIRF